jgi:hypothetical protein
VIEQVPGGLGLAGEGQTHDADDLRLVDDLSHDAGCLLGLAFGVELLQLDLAARVGLVVELHGQVGAVQDVLPERGVVTVDRAGVRQRDT